MDKKDVVTIAHSLIGFDVEKGFLEERTSLLKTASSIGINLEQKEEEAYIVSTVNGQITIVTEVKKSSDYEKALAIGAYLLHNKLVEDLSEEEFTLTTVFAVVVHVPNIMEHDGAGVADLIGFAKSTGLPFPALKNTLN